MVEVIFRFKQGKYPFGRGKQGEHTYMQYLLVTKNQDEVNMYRELNSIYKKIDNTNIMKLKKILKQNQTFHMLYEFQDKPLEKRLKQLAKQQQLADIFVELENVFQTLIQQRIKAQLYLQFMGVDEKNHLKVWIKPDEVQFLGSTSDSEKKIKKNLQDFYDTQRTRIHLEIEEIFQTNEYINSKQHDKKSNSQKQKNAVNTSNSSSTKGKTPNFVIEGNTLIFLNTSTQKSKGNTSYESEQNNKKQKQKNTMSKASHGVCQQKSKTNDQTKQTNQTQKNTQKTPVDLSKMSIAQKVLYYKKQKQSGQNANQQQKNLIIKDSSTSNMSQNDESKSSNTDSGIHIKTQMINKHKIKITTSQEVEVEGNSDDDLQKLARQKIAQIHKQKLERSHDIFRPINFQVSKKIDNSLNHGHQQKYLKGLEQSRQQKNEESSKQINSKIVQAKLKAKNILQKYGKN